MGCFLESASGSLGSLLKGSNMKYFTFFIAITLTVMFSACGGGSSSADKPIAKTATITTVAQAQSALYATQALMSDGGAMNVFNSLTGVSSASQLRQAITCGNGGSMDLNTISQSNYSIVFSHCSNEPGVYIDGGFSIVTNSNGTSGKFTMHNLEMINPQGTYLFDLSINYATTSSAEINLKMNGTGRIDENGRSASFFYDNFQMISGSNGVFLNGTVGVDYTPDLCSEGTYTIKTISPLYGSPTITSGEIEINGANFVYNPDGTVTITVNGTSEKVNQNALESTCI